MRSAATDAIILDCIGRTDTLVAYWDAGRVCAYANPAHGRWFGGLDEAPVGRPMSEMFAPLYEMTRPHIDAAYAGHQQVFECEITPAQGRPHRYATGTYLPHVVDGAVHGIFVLVADVTHIKQSERENRAARERLSLALDATQLSVWDYDIARGTVTFDERWARMMSLPPGLTVTTDRELAHLTHPAHRERVQHAAVLALKGTTPDFQYENCIRDGQGRWKWMRCSGRVVERSGQGKALRAVGTNLDITEQVQAEEEFRQIVLHDRLTGLPNRHLLEDRIQQMIAVARREQTRIALLFIDLDKFKPINDEKGHAVGDWLLHAVAQRMRAMVRESDTVARFGGDEFVVLSPDVATVDDALDVAEKIRSAVKDPYLSPDGDALEISCSVGVVIYPLHADNFRDLLRLGDDAMYRAKKRGRNAVEVVPSA